MKLPFLAVATMLATASAGSAQTGCNSQFLRGKFMIPYDSFMAMTAVSGQPCSKTFNTNGYMTFESIKITVRPEARLGGDGRQLQHRVSLEPGLQRPRPLHCGPWRLLAARQAGRLKHPRRGGGRLKSWAPLAYEGLIAYPAPLRCPA